MDESARSAFARAHAAAWEATVMTGVTPSIHTFRVPVGWSIEQTWEYIRRGETYPVGTTDATLGWVNVLAGTGRNMIRVLP